VAQLGDWLVLLAIQLGEAALHLIHRHFLISPSVRTQTEEAVILLPNKRFLIIFKLPIT
jgi:hypothetical protein